MSGIAKIFCLAFLTFFSLELISCVPVGSKNEAPKG